MTALQSLRLRALILLVLTLWVASLANGASADEQATSGVYTPPPREVSPFTSRNSFCSPQGNAFEGVAHDDPRLTVSGIPVVILVPPPDPSQAAEFPGLHRGDPVDEAQTFANLVNKCGGIGGRKLDLHVLPESGSPIIDCLAATRKLHAFIVLSLATAPAQSCITDEGHTIMVTESDVSNEMLAAAHGNLVATGTSEGVLQARILDLIQSGRLNGKRVGVVAGASQSDIAFAQMAAALLHANKIEPAPTTQADALLVPAIDASTAPLLSQAQNAVATAGRPPLDFYFFANASDQSVQQLGLSSITTPSVRQLGVFAYTPIEDEQGRLGQSAGAFTTMCNREYAANHGNGVKTTDLPQPAPPAASLAPYIQVARVCLGVRIVARALFNAGIDLTQASAVKALHKLPYIENELPDAVKKPRPNQVVNEPVTRAEQVVVLSQAEYPCEHPVRPKDPVAYKVCWAPVAGWDDGGHAVNAPLFGASTSAPSPPAGTALALSPLRRARARSTAHRRHLASSRMRG
jgi:hypothetical protein